MTTGLRCRPGIEILLERHADWLNGRKVGLVSHLAAVDSMGVSSAQRLAEADSFTLCALFGPEHGFFGQAPAGADVNSLHHPFWNVPVHSLYGETRQPTGAMLEGLDTLVFDIQDLGIRCYTYASTLRFVLEAAARAGLSVIVADRPIPYPDTLDGAGRNPDLESFVGALPVPLLYAMTPAETAQWIVSHYRLDIDLKVAPMHGYDRRTAFPVRRVPWIPPSPGIVSGESAFCYPATVFCEAFPAIDFGRATGLPFQVLGASWMNGAGLVSHFRTHPLEGAWVVPHAYTIAAGAEQGMLVNGIRLCIHDPTRFHPVEATVKLISALLNLHDPHLFWETPDARPGFFDKLMGDASVREQLSGGVDPKRIIEGWQQGHATFARSRADALLYATS